MFSPQYIAMSIDQATRTSSGFGVKQAQEMWKVSLNHSSYDQKIDLWFEQEEEARQFGQFQIYSPSQLIERTGISQSFEVQSIQQVTEKKINPYTDIPESEKVWKASLSAQDRAMDWSFASEREVREKFGGKPAYTVLDSFGTLVSVPEIVAASYQFVAQQAAEKAVELEEAKHKAFVSAEKAAEAKASALQQQTQKAGEASVAAANMYNQKVAAKEAAIRAANAMPIGTAAQNAARAQAIFNANNLDTDQYYADIQSTSSAYQQALAAYNNAQQQVKVLLAQTVRRTIPTGQINSYTISHGGAAGLYNGVYYGSGGFQPGPDHQWTGIYVAK